ncbi:MAG: hypothetical protein JWO38_2873 [Gemmataceae bacterium]|nr:hypothetical protein [Gemmataceae bacterium]
MRLPRLANPFRRRFRPGPLTPAVLHAMARNPSYRAPGATDLRNPDAAQPPDLPRLSETERQLLDAVLADPDADEPRLAYAAWADLQGDHARARLIRKQIQESRRLTQMKNDQDCPDRSSSALIGGSSSVFSAWGAKDLVFRRGFVEGMSLSGRAFISSGGVLSRYTPLREVQLVAVQPFMAELARCPHLANLRRLDLTGNRIGPAGVGELAGSTYLDGLREFELSGNDLRSNGAVALRTAPWLPNLTALGLADNRLGAADVQTLLATRVAELVALDLSGNPLGETGAAGLVESGVKSSLRRLGLSRCGFGPAGAGTLFQAGQLGSLVGLDVSFNGLGPDGAIALAEDGSLAMLNTLDLGFNDIEDDGADALATADALSSLLSLNLSANRLTPAGAHALAASGVFFSVESLDLTANPLGDAGAVALVRGDAFASLSRLALTNCGVTDAGVKSLTASGALGGLRALSLAWNPFGDDGSRALAACPDLGGLRELDLTGTRIGFAGAVALAESRNLVSLRSVVLGDNDRLPAEGVTILRERYNHGGGVSP